MMLSNKEESERESIWSVDRETKSLYFMVFIALVLIGAGLVTYEEVHVVKADGILDTVLAAWWGVGRLIPPSVAGALIVTEVWRNGLVLAERLEEWFDKRREKVQRRADSEGCGRRRVTEISAPVAGLGTNVGWRPSGKGKTFEEPPPSG